jgi:hypothetical protein
MKRIIAWLILMAVVSCSPATAQRPTDTLKVPSPEPLLLALTSPTLPPPAPSATSTFTQPPSPTVRATATTANVPNYIAYATERSIVVFRPDGSDIKSIPIPEGMQLERFSPDGRRGVLRRCDQETEYGVCIGAGSISLIGIPNGIIQPILEIPSFEKGDTDPSHWRYPTFQWADDGRYLVFSVAVSESSMAMYAYDVFSETLRRLADDSPIIYIKDVSPTGKWILFTQCGIPAELIVDVIWDCSLYETQPDNETNQGIRLLLKDVGSTGAKLNQWIDNEQVFFVNDCYRGRCNVLSILNAETGIAGDVIREEFVDNEKNIPSWNYDPENEKLLVFTSKRHMQLAALDGSLESLSLDILENGGTVPTVYFRDGPTFRFLMFGSHGWYGVTAEGHVEFLTDRKARSMMPWYSQIRDGPFVIFTDSGIDYFSAEDVLVSSWNNLEVRNVLWWPESQDVYLLTSRNDQMSIYRWSFPAAETSLVHTCRRGDPGWTTAKLVWVYE